MKTKKLETAEKTHGIRDSINAVAARLIKELEQEELTPQDKISFLKTLLPYVVGKLPNAAINYAIRNGQPASARIIEPTESGGEKSTWLYAE